MPTQAVINKKSPPQVRRAFRPSRVLRLGAYTNVRRGPRSTSVQVAASSGRRPWWWRDAWSSSGSHVTSTFPKRTGSAVTGVIWAERASRRHTGNWSSRMA
nr:hypothetical protein [Deinococcus sp.]